MRVLVTGAAGFIGMHCAERLLARGDEVTGADNLSPYYAVQLKQDRLRRLEGRKGFRFERVDLSDAAALERAFGKQAKQEMRPMQPGDVKATYADTRALAQAVGFAPSTPLAQGLARFAEWYKDYYRQA